MSDYILPGDIVGGSYRVLSELGGGSMGRVFDAHDLSLARDVALKIVTDAEWGDYLREEARALCHLRSPSFPTVHAAGVHDGLPFYVMEKLVGQSLHDVIQARRASADPLPIFEILRILGAVAGALARVHEAGIAHLDLKPGNVLLTIDGRVVLIDFGIFQIEADAHAAPVAGTPQYMAPEQLSGALERGERHLADLYSLGILAYELTTGSPPFDAQSVDEALGRIQAEFQPIERLRSDVPAALVELIDGLLVRDPTHRLQPAEAVALRLLELARIVVSSPSGSLRVLVVDDDPFACRLLSASVRKVAPGVQVFVAEGGDEGLRLAREKRPDIIFLDLRMPDRNGLEIAVLLREMPELRDTRIIPMSTRASEADLQVLRSLGAGEFIEKGAPAIARVQGIVREALQQRAGRG